MFAWALLTCCVAIVAAILGRHILLSVRRWRSVAWPRSLWSLLALSLRTAFIWFLVALMILFPFALSPGASDIRTYVAVILLTVGLPFKLAELLTWLPLLPDPLGSLPGSNGSLSYDIYSFFLVVAFLYVVGLLASIADTEIRKHPAYQEQDNVVPE